MPARPMSFQYHNKYSAAEGSNSESALLRSGRLGPAQHSFGDVAVQRFSFARDGGILHGQRSDWRWSFQGSRHRRAWLLFWLRPANAGESCYLIQLGGSHHSVHSLNCQNLALEPPLSLNQLDKMIPFVDIRKVPSPIHAGFRGIGQGKLSTK